MNINEKIEQLEQQLAELKQEVEQEEVEQFPKQGDTYYYIDDWADVGDDCWADAPYDQGRLTIGNVFETKAETEFALEKLKVEKELRDFSTPYDDRLCLPSIIYKAFDDSLDHVIHGTNQQGTIYFGDETQLNKAIEAVGEERIKKYIFGVTD